MRAAGVYMYARAFTHIRCTSDAMGCLCFVCIRNLQIVCPCPTLLHIQTIRGGRGDLKALKTLVNEGKGDPVHAVDTKGSTCLMWAAGNGHFEVVRWLAKLPLLDLNFPNKLGTRAWVCIIARCCGGKDHSSISFSQAALPSCKLPSMDDCQSCRPS